MKNFINYAHRGASSYAPENTMVAFKKAIELGANGIELDLQQTKDGRIVIFHDKKIDKKSNGLGKIVDHDYIDLYNLDFGSWFNIKFKGEHIVLFDDFAKYFLNKNLTFAIELKNIGYEKQVLDIIKKYSDLNNIYITSFKFKALENVRKIDSDIKISWLIEEKINEDNLRKLLMINGNQICPEAINVTSKDIEMANSKGVGVRLWGVTDEEIMKKVYKLNIEGMTVNFPDKLKEFLEKTKNES